MAEINIKDKLALDAFKTDRQSHIEVNQEICRRCDAKCCLYVCPARVYTLDEDSKVKVEFEACLECGTCFIACPGDAIRWDYPRGGFGVQFRYG